MKIAEAYVEVRAKTDKADQDLDAFEKRAGDSAKRTGTSFAQLFGGVAVGAGISKLISSASDLEQAVGGTAAVFGEASDSIDEFAKTSAESAGLSERAARELTSQLGGLLSGFGFTKDEAAGLSIQLTKLGADLSATFGGKPEEAVQALGAAMRGETDPIERYGISLNQAAVNAKAVELGLADSTSSVDANAKAQATLAIITEKSAGAQGQFAREADSAAGKAAISAAKAEDAAASMGDSLLPIYTKVQEVVGKTADVFGALPDGVQTGIVALAGVAAAAGPVKSAFETISDITGTVAKRLGRGELSGAAEGAASSLSKIGPALATAGFIGAATGIGILVGKMTEARVKGDELALALADVEDAQKGQAEELIRGLDAMGKLNGVTKEAASVNVEGAQRIVEYAEAAGLSKEKVDELRDIVEAKADADVQASVDQEANTEAVQAGTEANKEQTASIEDLLTKMEEHRQALLAQFDSNLAYRNAVDAASDGIRELAELQKSGTATTEDLDDATRELEGKMLAQATAAVKMAEDQAKANGATLDASEKNRIYKEQLQNLAGQLAPGSPLRAQLQGYIDQLNAVPDEIRTKLVLSVQQAGATVANAAAAAIAKAKPHAQGGSFQAGDVLEVGEAGREVVQFGQPGTVVPNHDLRGGRSVQIGELHFHGVNPREAYDETLWKIGLAG